MFVRKVAIILPLGILIASAIPEVGTAVPIREFGGNLPIAAQLCAQGSGSNGGHGEGKKGQRESQLHLAGQLNSSYAIC